MDKDLTLEGRIGFCDCMEFVIMVSKGDVFGLAGEEVVKEEVPRREAEKLGSLTIHEVRKHNHLFVCRDQIR